MFICMYICIYIFNKNKNKYLRSRYMKFLRNAFNYNKINNYIIKYYVFLVFLLININFFWIK